MKTIPLLRRPYAKAKLCKLVGQSIREVIEIPLWESVMGHFEALNDYVSDKINGSECGLENITYKLVGCDTKAQTLFMEVEAEVSDYFDD